MTLESNKRIIKNTFFLYFRMILTMLISLFTVRIVLNTLGVEDYGIYNVVGGVVAMFSVLSGTMASASQRFFAYELGLENLDKLKRTFSATMTIYILITLIVFILSETIGLWFINNKMVFPDDRLEAANWVYQFSIFSFVFTLITIPYHASIIAHERMNMYAYVSIVEVVLKLLVVYLLLVFSIDKLKLYSILIFAITFLNTTIYRNYCKQKFEECRYKFQWEPVILKKLLSFSGWTLVGVTANMLNNHGVNILLNIFFGPVVNAARGIAYQLSSRINQFVSNFLSAVRPQIIKNYAQGNRKQFLDLIFGSAKISYFLLFIITLPLLIETEFILTLWLKEPPENTIIFTRLVIIATLIESITYPLNTASTATGNIKKYQIVVGSILLVNLPISYVFLKLGHPPEITFYINIVILAIGLFLRLWVLKELILLPIKEFLINVIFTVIFSSSLGYIIPLVITKNLESGLNRFIFVCISGVLTAAISIYFLGLRKKERDYILKLIMESKFKKLLFFKKK